MNRLGRTSLVLAACLTMSLGLAGPAAAAAPANDTWTGATDVTVLPETFTQDTTEATTDSVDAALNATFCGAPYTNASVWFKYTAPGADGFMVTMANSDYTGGFMVTAGAPSPANLVGCAATEVGVVTTPGTTYYVMAFSDTTTVGGNLVVTFDVAPPPPTISATINPTGIAYRDGTALVSGTYTCSNASVGGKGTWVEGTATQQVGRFRIVGNFFIEPLTCDGNTQQWSAQAYSDTGLFRGGKAGIAIGGFACGLLTCTDFYTSANIRLTMRAR